MIVFLYYFQSTSSFLFKDTCLSPFQILYPVCQSFACLKQPSNALYPPFPTCYLPYFHILKSKSGKINYHSGYYLFLLLSYQLSKQLNAKQFVRLLTPPPKKTALGTGDGDMELPCKLLALKNHLRTKSHCLPIGYIKNNPLNLIPYLFLACRHGKVNTPWYSSGRSETILITSINEKILCSI